DKQLQPAYDYTMARLKARIAQNYEYNYLLSDVRTESLPALPPEHGAWRLQPQENMQARGLDGKEAAKRAKEAREAIDQLAESQPRWKQMAERDHILTTGLRWITAP